MLPGFPPANAEPAAIDYPSAAFNSVGRNWRLL